MQDKKPEKPSAPKGWSGMVRAAGRQPGTDAPTGMRLLGDIA
ncbi:MAG: hypothetical protein U5K56_13225 [Halioglobus sp.]|nr:hypothetical protein [Halioglobus sp.]